MPFVTTPLGAEGPLVDMYVAMSTPRVDALKASGRPFPRPVQIRALIDTGASCSAIDPWVVQALGLVSSGTTHIHTPSTGAGSHPCNQYDVCLAFVSPEVRVVSVTIPVIEAELFNQGIKALIGRDVLEKCLLVYNGPAKLFTIALP